MKALCLFIHIGTLIFINFYIPKKSKYNGLTGFQVKDMEKVTKLLKQPSTASQLVLTIFKNGANQPPSSSPSTFKSDGAAILQKLERVCLIFGFECSERQNCTETIILRNDKYQWRRLSNLNVIIGHCDKNFKKITFSILSIISTRLRNWVPNNCSLVMKLLMTFVSRIE